MAAVTAGDLDPLRVALMAFERLLGRRSRPFSFKRQGLRLRRALARGDRYGAYGTAYPGMAFEQLLHAIATAAEWQEVDALDGKEPPATLAWFIVGLDRETKSWRHGARHAAGRCGDACRYEHRYHPKAKQAPTKRGRR